MPEMVTVSDVEKVEKLKGYLEDLFRRGRYSDIARAVGMHSILIDPQHTISDQAQLYRSVLEMIKNKVNATLGKNYSPWLAAFPKIMAELAVSKQAVTDAMSAEIIASHHAAYGPFKSVDAFFFWALEDRRLTLDQIVKYIEKTAQMYGK